MRYDWTRIPQPKTGVFTAVFFFCCCCFYLTTFCLQVQQNIQVAVTEYAKLKQQLEKNTAIIEVLGHLKEVQNNSKLSHDILSLYNKHTFYYNIYILFGIFWKVTKEYMYNFCED